MPRGAEPRRRRSLGPALLEKPARVGGLGWRSRRGVEPRGHHRSRRVNRSWACAASQPGVGEASKKERTGCCCHRHRLAETLVSTDANDGAPDLCSCTYLLASRTPWVGSDSSFNVAGEISVIKARNGLCSLVFAGVLPKSAVKPRFAGVLPLPPLRLQFLLRSSSPATVSFVFL